MARDITDLADDLRETGTVDAVFEDHEPNIQLSVNAATEAERDRIREIVAGADGYHLDSRSDRIWAVRPDG